MRIIRSAVRQVSRSRPGEAGRPADWPRLTKQAGTGEILRCLNVIVEESRRAVQQIKYSNLSAQHRPNTTGTDLRPALTTSTDFHATRSHRGGHLVCGTSQQCKPSSQASLPCAETGSGCAGAVCAPWTRSHRPSWRRLTDLHAIRTHPATFPHTRELRWCTKGHSSQGESATAGGAARLRQAGAFLLKGNPPGRYPLLG